MTEPTILINDVYSHHNRGDSALTEVLVHYIRDVLPNARIYLLSQFWEENRHYFDPLLNATSVPLLWDVPMDANKLRRLVRAAGSFGRLAGAYMWGRPAALSAELTRQRDTLELYRQADILIDKGGGSLYSSERYPFYLSIYQHLLGLWVGTRLCPTVIMAPQSIGPLFRRHDRMFTKAVLSRLDMVMVRDPASRILLSKMGVDHVLVPDAAFLDNFVTEPTERVMSVLSQLPSDRIRVGAVVLDWRRYVRGYKDDFQAVDRYLETLADSLQEVGQSYPLNIFVFPHVVARHRDSDLGASQALVQKIRDRGAKAELIEGDFSASDQVHLYGAMDAFVGSRMHSTIFAMLRGVPTIGLSYQPKMTGTYQILGLEDFVMDVTNVDGGALSERLGEMLADLPTMRDRFRQCVREVRLQVAEAFAENLRPLLAVHADGEWTDTDGRVSNSSRAEPPNS